MRNATGNETEGESKFSFDNHSILNNHDRKGNNVASSILAMPHIERTQRELAEEILRFLSQKEKEVFASAMPRLQEAGAKFLDKITSPAQVKLDQEASYYQKGTTMLSSKQNAE